MSWMAVAIALAVDPPWRQVERTRGVLLEAREVTGSSFVELRLTTQVSASVDRLCDEAFGSGKFDPLEPDLKSRLIISETENERVTYDQLNPPVVANRDYAVRAKRERLKGDVCRMSFEAANDVAPPPQKGWVRISKLSGAWLFSSNRDGSTRVEYTIHTDPAGSLPAFLVEGVRRKTALRWFELIASRARLPKEPPP